MSNRDSSGSDGSFEYQSMGIPLPKELDTPEKRLDPFPWYRQMRNNEPVRYDPYREVWDVFRYEDIKPILESEPSKWSSEVRPLDQLKGTPFEPFTKTMVQDPPIHDRMRRAVEEYFQPGYLRDQRDQLNAVAERQIDRVLQEGSEFDFRQDLARYIPVNTISALLGVPVDRREDVRKWSFAHVAARSTGSDDSGLSRQEILNRIKEMFDYVDDLIDEKRENPEDDIISELVQKEVGGEPLSQMEINMLATTLIIAGNVTTINFLTNTVWTTYEEGILHDFARGDINRQPVLEEVLRYRSPAKSIKKTPAEDVELHGKTIPEGERVELWLGSANRDERKFDEPDAFKPERRPNPHIAFGRGIHFCLGAPLARLEAEVLFDMLFDRIDSMEVDTDAVEPLNSYVLYGTRKLPVSVER